MYRLNNIRYNVVIYYLEILHIYSKISARKKHDVSKKSWSTSCLLRVSWIPYIYIIINYINISPGMFENLL